MACEAPRPPGEEVCNINLQGDAFQPATYKAWPFVVTFDPVTPHLGPLRESRGRPRPTQKEVPLSIIYKGTQLDATQRFRQEEW